MKNLTLREMQLEELNLLKEFIDICKKYSLKYYLTDGTLLGAIRHKGFIPWDDDIDLFMPRPDYDKLIELVISKKIKLDKKYEFVSKEINDYFTPFVKLVNKNIRNKAENHFEKYLWIDIFALDGVSSDKRRAKKVVNFAFILGHLYAIKLVNFRKVLKSSHSKKADIIKFFAKIPMIFVSKKALSKLCIKFAKKYDYNSSKYVANTVWTSEQRQVYEKKLFDNEIDVQFEDISAKAFSGYDMYLKQTYGDYMKLPPEDKRYVHGQEFYYTNDCE